MAQAPVRGLRDHLRARQQRGLARGQAHGVVVGLEQRGGGRVPRQPPAGRAHRLDERLRRAVTLDGEAIELDELGCIDESAGFHERLTEWEWSAGVGTLTDGRTVGWNLVTGIHDAEHGSERTLWIDGVPQELEPVTFSDALDAITFPGGEQLAFASEAVSERDDDLGLFKSDYVQPFGTFTGAFPGGLTLAEGRGVMERHRALW